MLRDIFSFMTEQGSYCAGCAVGFFCAIIMVIGTTACIAALQLLAAFLA